MGQKDSMMYNSLFKQQLKKGDFSWNNFSMLLSGKYTTDYSRALFWKPLFNSIMMSAYASIISIIVGGVIAFLITRTDVRFKKFISSVFIFPYLMPSWTLALVWKNVFINSSVGNGITGWFEAVTGICVPQWFVYGMFPCAIILGIHYAPFAYILVGGVLRNMEANLEEAATILKADRLRIIRKITLPIVLPSMISTLLLVFSSSMASFSTPNFIGSPGNFFVLSTMLKSLYQSNYSGQAYVMTLVLLLFGIGFLVLNHFVVGKRKSFTTVTGKSGQVSYIRLGKLNTLISVILIILLFFFAVFPLISFAVESLCLIQGDYSRLTLRYWLSGEDIQDLSRNVGKGLLRNSRVWGALWGSLKLSIIVALIVGTCGFLIGYGVARKRGSKLADAVSYLAFFPYLIPTMAFGAIWLSVASKLPFLRGTFILLVLVASIKYLPFASRSGTSAMMQLSGEIEESALIVGAPWFVRMTKILFPIQKSSFISGYLLPFVSCMRELTLFVLLADKDSVITMLLSYYDDADISQMSNGVNLLIIIVVLTINLIVNKLTGASIDKGIGGN
jgi:iron(III) transport system permease protein